jgi:hypothetical protein
VTTVCGLRLATGVVETCSDAACVLWDEPSGACALDSLAPEVRRRPDLAEHLLELRAALDEVARRWAPTASGY